MKTTIVGIEKLNEMAKEMAQFSYDNLFQCHRGTYEIAHNLYGIFGNDGYARDKRSQVVAQAVKKTAKKKGLFASDIQVSRGGYSWAVLVFCNDEIADELVEVAWKVWVKESDKKEAQQKKSKKVA
jgi:hypothetical protein